MLKSMVFQSKVLKVRGPGVAHALFFWGFLLLFIGTCLIVLQADFTDLLFGIKFFKGTFYLLFSVVLDLAGLVAIAMLFGLLIRRYIIRPEGLESTKDDAIMHHGLLFAILINLGRHNDIYEAPRNLIRAVGGKIIEMEKNRSEAFCCSAGGWRILAEEKLGSRINIKRVNMAAKTDSPTLVSNCPFCLTMFEDGIKGAELEEQIVSRDIAEILAEHLKETV